MGVATSDGTASAARGARGARDRRIPAACFRLRFGAEAKTSTRHRACFFASDRRARARDRRHRRQSARPRNGAERRRRRGDRRADRQQRARTTSRRSPTRCSIASATCRRGSAPAEDDALTSPLEHGGLEPVRQRCRARSPPSTSVRRSHVASGSGGMGSSANADMRSDLALHRLCQQFADERRQRDTLAGITARRPDIRLNLAHERKARCGDRHDAAPAMRDLCRRELRINLPEDAGGRRRAHRPGFARRCFRRRRRPSGHPASCANSGRRSGCRPPTARRAGFSRPPHQVAPSPTTKLLMPSMRAAGDPLQLPRAPVGRHDDFFGADFAARRPHHGIRPKQHRRGVLVDRRPEAGCGTGEAKREPVGIEMAAAAIIDAAEESLATKRRDRRRSVEQRCLVVARSARSASLPTRRHPG